MPIDIPDPVLANSPSLHGLLSLHLFTVKTFVTFTNDSVGGLIDCLYDTLVEPQDVIKNNNNVIYCAWGFGISTPKWLTTILKNKTIKALELSKLGTPKHPLYLDSKLIPVKFTC